MTTLTIDVEKLEEVGDNVKSTIVDDHIVFLVDLETNLGESKNGKSISIANSHGFKPLKIVEKTRFMLWVGRPK